MAEKKRQSGSGNGNWRGGHTVKCPVCGNEFWKTPGNNQVFCSNICFHKVRFGSRKNQRWDFCRHANGGKRQDLGIFVRSTWEANYARYLNWLKTQRSIADWEYEAETFEFHGIRRGTKFYTPDFKVTNSNGATEYHEVKGYMHPKGKTALDRMSRYYPQVKIILIQKPEYEAIKKSMKSLLPHWE